MQSLEIESVLCFTRFSIHSAEQISNHLHGFRNIILILAVGFSVLEHIVKQKGITGKSGSWLGQVTVEFKFPGLFSSLGFVDKF